MLRHDCGTCNHTLLRVVPPEEHSQPEGISATEAEEPDPEGLGAISRKHPVAPPHPRSVSGHSVALHCVRRTSAAGVPISESTGAWHRSARRLQQLRWPTLP